MNYSQKRRGEKVKLFLAAVLTLMFLGTVTWGKKFLRNLIFKHRRAVPLVLVMFVRDCEEFIEGLVRDLINWRQLNGFLFELVIVVQSSRDASRLILEKLNYPYQEFILLSPEEYSRRKILAGRGETNTVVYHLDENQGYTQALSQLKNLILQHT